MLGSRIFVLYFLKIHFNFMCMCVSTVCMLEEPVEVRRSHFPGPEAADDCELPCGLLGSKVNALQEK